MIFDLKPPDARQNLEVVHGAGPCPAPRPRESFTLLCVRCGSSLYYVCQDRARGVFEHRYDCRRCGQRHAA